MFFSETSTTKTRNVEPIAKPHGRAPMRAVIADRLLKCRTPRSPSIIRSRQQFTRPGIHKRSVIHAATVNGGPSCRHFFVCGMKAISAFDYS